MTYKAPDTPEIELENRVSTAQIQPGEIIIGTLSDINEQGQPRVTFYDGNGHATHTAMSTMGLTRQQLGRQVALLFANGEISNPVIMGIIHSPLQDMLESFDVKQSSEMELRADRSVDNVQVDGERIVFKGKKEIVLKCGEASITLTRSGKVLIRGKYLLNRSSGVNRIMGGSVQVN